MGIGYRKLVSGVPRRLVNGDFRWAIVLVSAFLVFEIGQSFEINPEKVGIQIPLKNRPSFHLGIGGSARCLESIDFDALSPASDDLTPLGRAV